jgi:hypothetical protein
MFGKLFKTGLSGGVSLFKELLKQYVQTQQFFKESTNINIQVVNQLYQIQQNQLYYLQLKKIFM